MRTNDIRQGWIILAAAAVLWSAAVAAQTTTTTDPGTSTDPVTGLGGAESRAEKRIVNEFKDWSGSEDNARSLVTGLRQGGEITLTGDSTGSGSTGGGATFASPTRPMGYGNVRIALKLAQTQLASSGITEPTADQIQAALVGGSVSDGSGTSTTSSELTGVLQMRADGMGWGQIANSMGVKLGQVMSGKTAPTAAATSTAMTTAAGTAGATTSSGITNAAGKSSTSVRSRERGNSEWAHQTHGSGAGIVTAAGGSAGSANGVMRAQGGGAVRAGVVTAAGAGGAGAAGKGNGRGHGNR